MLLSRADVLHLIWRASDLQNRVATQCLQLHGGWGYMWEYPIAKLVSRKHCNRELWLFWFFFQLINMFAFSGHLWTHEFSLSTEEPTRSWRSSSPVPSSARSETGLSFFVTFFFFFKNKTHETVNKDLQFSFFFCRYYTHIVMWIISAVIAVQWKCECEHQYVHWLNYTWNFQIDKGNKRTLFALCSNSVNVQPLYSPLCPF